MERTETLGTFALLFDELTDGVCVSSEGSILYLNPAAAKMLDLPPAKTREADFCELLCGHLAVPGKTECASDCPLRRPDSGKKDVTFAGKYGIKEGFRWEGEKIRRFSQSKDLRVRCYRLPGGWFDSSESEKHLTLIEDISDQMELERQQEAWRSMVAHDLRSPLTGILGFLALLDDLPAADPKAKELVAAALKSGRRMLEQLNDHLDLAKLDAGKMPVHREDVALRELALECVAEASALAAAKKIEVVIEIEAGLRARADRGLLFRVIQNLLSNAVKFTHQEGKITISGGIEEGFPWFSVRDTGIGIPEEELPLLFDRFHQVKARQEGRVRGTGLGLAFCAEVLKAMNGRIQVRSRLGKGSEFVVELPVAEDGGELSCRTTPRGA